MSTYKLYPNSLQVTFTLNNRYPSICAVNKPKLSILIYCYIVTITINAAAYNYVLYF